MYEICFNSNVFPATVYKLFLKINKLRSDLLRVFLAQYHRLYGKFRFRVDC